LSLRRLKKVYNHRTLLVRQIIARKKGNVMVLHLRAVRQAQGKTLEDIATPLGCSIARISLQERQLYALRLTDFVAWALVLETHPHALVSYEEFPLLACPCGAPEAEP